MDIDRLLQEQIKRKILKLLLQQSLMHLKKWVMLRELWLLELWVAQEYHY